MFSGGAEIRCIYSALTYEEKLREISERSPIIRVKNKENLQFYF